MKILLPFFIFLLGAMPTAKAGLYMEFKTKSTGKTPFSGSMKMWTQNGNGRTEMKTVMEKSKEMEEAAKMGVATSTEMVMIVLKDKPNKAHSINEKNKTYSIIETNTDSITGARIQPASDFTITIVGNETINGFASTHLVIKDKNEKQPQHWWLARDLKYSKEMMQTARGVNLKGGLQKAMAAKGFGEKVPVKIKTSEGDGEMLMELVKFEEVDVPASKFSLSGYKLVETPGFGAVGGTVVEFTPEEQKELEDALKDIMPAESIKTYINTIKMMPAETRKKMIEQMKKAAKKEED